MCRSVFSLFVLFSCILGGRAVYGQQSTAAIAGTPPVISCPQQAFVPANVEIVLQCTAYDPDPGDTFEWTVSTEAWFSGWYFIVDGALHITPSVMDAGLWSFTVRVTDSEGGYDECIIEVIVVVGSSLEVRVRDCSEKPGEPGHIVIGIDLTRVDLPFIGPIWDFTFLLGYDTSRLEFATAEPGQGLIDCGWEYFDFAREYDCLGWCPYGLVRSRAVAEIENGDMHPYCFLNELSLPAGLLELEFIDLTGSITSGEFVPLQFFWVTCDDNVIHYSRPEVWDTVAGISAAVIDYGGLVQPGSIEYQNGGWPLPSYFGAPDGCLNWGPDTDTLRVIDYYSVLSTYPHLLVNAVIDSIAPGSADPGQTVAFGGHGREYGPFSGYEWRSSLDGLIGSDSAFGTSALSIGEHKIFFRVQDSYGMWSADESALLRVGLPAECCGEYTGGYTGNANCSADGKRNLSDVTRLIDFVYITHAELCCPEEGNTNGSVDGKVNLSDVTRLIDYVYISHTETAACP